MPSVASVEKIINVLVPKAGENIFVRKPENVSIFTGDLNKLRYVHNIVQYKPRRIEPDEVRSMFIGGQIDGGFIREEMKAQKRQLFFSSFTGLRNYKKWKHSINLSRELTDSDLREIANFMNLHNGRYINIWKGYNNYDNIANIEKLALFVRSIKRIDKLNFYKSLNENSMPKKFSGKLIFLQKRKLL